jgi:hypothetical protein
MALSGKIELGYKLYPAQLDALNSRAREILFGGQAGPGKSYLLRVAAITWAIQFPGIQIYIFRRTYPELRDNHLEGPSKLLDMLSELTEKKLVSYNSTEKTFYFWNGSAINLRHVQRESDMTKYKGVDIHVLLIDELTTFTEKIYRYLRSRVRMTGVAFVGENAKYAELFPRIINASNPGDIGHAFVKRAFVDHGPGLWQAPASEGGFTREYIPAPLSQNKELLKQSPNYFDALEGLGSRVLVEAMRYGNWEIIGGLAFADVWRSDQILKTPFKLPRNWRVYRTFDYGDSKPFSVGYFAYVNYSYNNYYIKGDKIRIGELYGWNGRENEGARMSTFDIGRAIRDYEEVLKAAYDIETIYAGPADSAIFYAETGHKSIYTEIVEGVYGGGIKKELFTAAKKQGNEYGRRGRFLAFRDCLRNAIKREGIKETPRPALFAFDTCEQFARTIPLLPQDKTKLEDVDTTAEDHIYDESAYFITYNPMEANTRPLTF